MELSRRTFLKITSATTTALALGPERWGWAQEGSPFGPRQEDALISLPEGYSYQIVARTGDPLTGGRGPFPRPAHPDLNCVFKQPDGKMILSTSHEVPEQAPVLSGQPPQEEYDRVAHGAVTSLLLGPDLSVIESAYNAGGMINNCSGGQTPWGTVLTGEESTQTYEAEHGFVWEVDIDKHTKTRLDDCGKFEHEAAKVHRGTGYVYLTEDSGTDSLLYRMRPKERGKLHKGGVLEAYRKNGTWARIPDPLAKEQSTAEQGIAKGALKFSRLEGARFDGHHLYFTETEDEVLCGKVWRLNLRTQRLESFADGKGEGPNQLCMPDNIATDAAGNFFVCEDREIGPNRVMFLDRRSGKISEFAVLTQPYDEPTGTSFSPDSRVLFLNLMRNADFGVTLAITGPFAAPNRSALLAPATPPAANESIESRALRESGLRLGASLSAAAALVALRRRGRTDRLDEAPLEEIAVDLGPPARGLTPPRVERRAFRERGSL